MIILQYNTINAVTFISSQHTRHVSAENCGHYHAVLQQCKR